METIQYIRSLLSKERDSNFLFRRLEKMIEPNKKIDNPLKLWFHFSKYISTKSADIKQKLPFIELITLDLGVQEDHMMHIYHLMHKSNNSQLELNFNKIEEGEKKFLEKIAPNLFNFDTDTFSINIIGHIDNTSQIITESADFFIDFYLDFEILPTIKPIAIRDLDYPLTEKLKKDLIDFFRHKTLVYDKLT